jgi:hypothetical protein
MFRLQVAVVIVVISYAVLNGFAGMSLAKASQAHSQQYAETIEAAMR